MLGTESDARQLFDDYVVPTYRRYDVVLVRGQGSRVWDEKGKEYLDFGAGIAVSTLGHAHPCLIDALVHQSRELIHASNLYYTRPQGELARRLVNIVGSPGKIFFSNSGAESNEAVVKLARKFGNECLGLDGSGEPRIEILTFERSFHGRTMAGISATAQPKVKEGFAPLLTGFRHLPFDDLSAVRSAVNERTAAILVEPVQGEGGIYPASREFLLGLREICDTNGLLLMFDEIQCGLGRLGTWCGWSSIAQEGLVPDCVSWAKGIGGGFPLGATWIRKKPVKRLDGSSLELCDLLQPGSHGTTYGGTPLACSVSLAVLETIEKEDLLGNASRLGAYAKEKLKSLPGVAEVRGIGLMLGIEIAENFVETGPEGTAAQKLVSSLLANGLLSVPAGPSVVRWLPPLNVSRSEVDQAVSILAETLLEMHPGA